jgi:hypothetical protein
MKLGNQEIGKSPHLQGVERKIVDVLTHPKYSDGNFHFNVGIAIAGKQLENTTIL